MTPARAIEVLERASERLAGLRQHIGPQNPAALAEMDEIDGAYRLGAMALARCMVKQGDTMSLLEEATISRLRRNVAEGIQRRIIESWRSLRSVSNDRQLHGALQAMAKRATANCIEEVPEADWIVAEEWGKQP